MSVCNNSAQTEKGKISMKKLDFAKSCAMDACMPMRYMWQRTCVPVWFTWQSTCMPTCQVCQVFIFRCQCATRHANFSTWWANVPKSIPIFQTFLLWNAKGNFYTLLLYKTFYIILDIILIHIICIWILHTNCTILCFLKLFWSLVRNGNIIIIGYT